MLTITIPEVTLWDEDKNEFIPSPIPKSLTLQLEHSLISLSKWESKWKRPFLGKEGEKGDRFSDEELLDYVRCMTITQNVHPDVYKYIPANVMYEITDYTKDAMTATWFGKDKEDSRKGRNREETITAEIIYYQMIALNIPIEFQKWHLNRLLTLIKVCAIKQEEASKPKDKNKRGLNKMTKNQIQDRRAMNQARLKAMSEGG